MTSTSRPTTLSDVSVAEVQKRIRDAIVPVSEHEHVSLPQGLNRILADDIIAPIDIPAFDNSAMDGFAFCAGDLNQLQEFTIVGHSHAGHPYEKALKHGQAICITTGARMPDGADCVLPLELAELRDSTTLTMRSENVKVGQNHRQRGEEMAAGSTVLSKGKRLGAAELGMLAALGIQIVPVQRTLRIAIFSTGDELQNPGQPLSQASVYDSNRFSLAALLNQFGTQVIDLGILADDPEAIKTALKNNIDQADVIISSGGVSIGAADFTKQVMQDLAQMHFWSVNMRPGRPLAFGNTPKSQSSGKTYLFGLPGNPVAMMVSFYFFVRPALQLLNGSDVTEPLSIAATIDQPIMKKFGRTEFQRGICSADHAGRLHVSSTGDQGSAMLSSMSKANCLILLEPEQQNILAGDRVKVLLFDGLV